MASFSELLVIFSLGVFLWFRPWTKMQDSSPPLDDAKNAEYHKTWLMENMKPMQEDPNFYFRKK